jgi:hypothetical protein
MREKHVLMDGKLYIYKRKCSPFWQCCSYLGGYNYRQSTRQRTAPLAIEFARECFSIRSPGSASA